MGYLILIVYVVFGAIFATAMAYELKPEKRNWHGIASTFFMWPAWILVYFAVHLAKEINKY